MVLSRKNIINVCNLEVSSKILNKVKLCIDDYYAKKQIENEIENLKKDFAFVSKEEELRRNYIFSELQHLDNIYGSFIYTFEKDLKTISEIDLLADKVEITHIKLNEEGLFFIFSFEHEENFTGLYTSILEKNKVEKLISIGKFDFMKIDFSNFILESFENSKIKCSSQKLVPVEENSILIKHSYETYIPFNINDYDSGFNTFKESIRELTRLIRNFYEEKYSGGINVSKGLITNVLKPFTMGKCTVFPSLNGISRKKIRIGMNIVISSRILNATYNKPNFHPEESVWQNQIKWDILDNFLNYKLISHNFETDEELNYKQSLEFDIPFDLNNFDYWFVDFNNRLRDLADKEFY